MKSSDEEKGKFDDLQEAYNILYDELSYKIQWEDVKLKKMISQNNSHIESLNAKHHDMYDKLKYLLSLKKIVCSKRLGNLTLKMITCLINF